MQEWSDEELDKLFQKSAEEFDPQYEPTDWRQLRRRLDQSEGIAPGAVWLKKVLPYLVLALLLLVGGLGLYYGTYDETGTSEGNPRPAPDQVQAPVLPPGKEAVELKNRDLELEKNRTDRSDAGSRSRKKVNAQDANKDLKELPRNLASVSGVRRQSNQSDQERGEGAILLPKNSAEQPSENPGTPLPRKNRDEVPGMAERKEMGSPQISAETPQQLTSPDSKASTPQLLNKEGTLLQNFSGVEPLASRKNFLKGNALPYPAVVFVADSLTMVHVPGLPERKVPLWSVRLGVSPDLSVVRMTDMMRSMHPGPSASLLVERGISTKWTLQTGIVRSLKKYSAPFSEYHPAKNIYGQKTMPVSVDGACTVFEVPLNVRFDFSQRPKTRWFAGAGVSSYKMQKENYIYNYDTYVHNAAKGWGGSTGWYFLSHANASVGYERRLTERLSVVVEPYMRIPLRGVGFGKVNLFSGGTWFSLRYTPVFRK